MNTTRLFRLLPFLCICTFFFTCSDDPKPSPVVAFTASVGSNGLVSFRNNSVNADTYTWSFGDGNTSTEQNPVHTYDTNGTFTVILNGKGSGGSGSFSSTVTISDIKSTLTFTNRTFTIITISVNSFTQTIPVGGSVSFTDKPGVNATISASTSGKTTSGIVIGLRIAWAFTSSFPSKNELVTNLDVDSNYFFLFAKNTSGVAISKVYVNYGLVNQTTDDILIPSDGVTYSIGYYKAFTNSNIRMENGNYYWFNNTMSLPFTSNQSFSFSAI